MHIYDCEYELISVYIYIYVRVYVYVRVYIYIEMHIIHSCMHINIYLCVLQWMASKCARGKNMISRSASILAAASGTVGSNNASVLLARPHVCQVVIHASIFIHAYMLKYVYMYTYMCTYICTYICMHTYNI